MPEITGAHGAYRRRVDGELPSRLSAMVAELDSHDSRHDPTGERGPMPLFGLFDGLVSRFNDEVPSPKPCGGRTCKRMPCWVR